MTVEHGEILDAEFLGRLRALFLKLRKRRQLKKKGSELAPHAGSTREFKDHRHYVAGDDFRSVDWRLYARLERLFIRIYEEIQEYHVHVVLDRSASMGEPWPMKRLLAQKLAVALSYLALASQHRVSLVTIGRDARRELPPLKGQGHIHDVLRAVAALEFGGTTALNGSLRTFKPGRDRRGVVFVISDLYGSSSDDSREAVRHALRWPAETHIVHVIDPRERAPGLEGEHELVDVETGEMKRMWLTSRDAATYSRRFDEFVSGIRSTCMKHTIDYVTWTTEGSFEDLFLELLTRGSALTEW
jgi:uncharacterized protein (DUF58 family)